MLPGETWPWVAPPKVVLSHNPPLRCSNSATRVFVFQFHWIIRGTNFYLTFSQQNAEAWNNLSHVYIKKGQKCVQYLCSIQLYFKVISIGNRMNASAFRDLWERVIGECKLRTFKTSRVTINHEMDEQVHAIIYSLYTQQNHSIALFP